MNFSEILFRIIIRITFGYIIVKLITILNGNNLSMITVCIQISIVLIILRIRMRG